MLPPAEPVKPVSQPRRASLSAMYSLWGWDGEVRGDPRAGTACVGMAPHHVGIRGGHDVGVDVMGTHGIPQSAELCRAVGGRGRQVLVAQRDRQEWGWAGGRRSTPGWAQAVCKALTGGSTEQSLMSVLGEAASCERPTEQPEGF